MVFVSSLNRNERKERRAELGECLGCGSWDLDAGAGGQPHQGTAAWANRLHPMSICAHSTWLK